MLWESSKNQFGRPKKNGRQNFGKFFENPPPPLEKILDPALIRRIVTLVNKLIFAEVLNSLVNLALSICDCRNTKQGLNRF